MIPAVTLDKCEFVSDRGVLKLASEHVGMPAKLRVRSHKTGRSVMFHAVQPGDPMWDQDGWDGEQCIYRPAESDTRVNYLVIYHQY